MSLFTNPETPIDAVKVKHRFTPDELGRAMHKKFVENSSGIGFEDWFEGYDFPQLTAFDLKRGRVIVAAAATTPERVEDAVDFLTSRPDWIGECWLVTYWNLLNPETLDDQLGLLEADAGLRLREKNHAKQSRPEIPKGVLSRLVDHTVREQEQLQETIESFEVTVEGEVIDGMQAFYERLNEQKKQIERGQNEQALQRKVAERVKKAKGELKQAVQLAIDAPVETPGVVQDVLAEPDAFDLDQLSRLVEGLIEVAQTLKARKTNRIEQRSVKRHLEKAKKQLRKALSDEER